MTSHHISELEHALAQQNIPEGIVIRAWQEQDFAAIQRLSEAEGWPTPNRRPEDALAGWRNSWPTLVAEVDGEVIGFVRAWSDKHITTYIFELLIAEQWRGHGIGSSLLDACHTLYPHARLEVSSTEHSASFYRRYGFRDLGETFRKSYV